MIDFAPYIRNWQSMHDNGYFRRHKHYGESGYPIGDMGLDQKLRKHVELKADDQVLEIGCGYGRLMWDIVDQVQSIVGTDLHEDPLEHAKRLFAGKPQARVILCDGESIPLPDESVTLVYAWNVFQHMPRALVEEYLRDTMRVLKNHGRLFCQFFKASGKHGKDIDVDPRLAKEQSVPWTKQEVLMAGVEAGFNTTITTEGTHVYLIGRKEVSVSDE